MKEENRKNDTLGKKGASRSGRGLEDGARKMNRNNLNENAITEISLICILIKKLINSYIEKSP